MGEGKRESSHSEEAYEIENIRAVHQTGLCHSHFAVTMNNNTTSTETIMLEFSKVKVGTENNNS